MCYQLWALPLNLSFATAMWVIWAFLSSDNSFQNWGWKYCFSEGILVDVILLWKKKTKHQNHSHSYKGKSLTGTFSQFLRFSVFSSLQGEWWHADRHGVWEIAESSPSRSTSSKKSKRYWAWVGLLKTPNPKSSDTLSRKRPCLLQQSVPPKPCKVVPLPAH